MTEQNDPLGIHPQPVKRSLKYEFSAVEIHDMSLQLAAKTKERLSLEEEKKAVGSQFKARIDEVTATCNKLSNHVSDGFEYRDIDCRIEFHKPSQGRKSYVRLDTGKVALIEPMTNDDHNLFNAIQ